MQITEKQINFIEYHMFRLGIKGDKNSIIRLRRLNKSRASLIIGKLKAGNIKDAIDKMIEIKAMCLDEQPDYTETQFID